MLQSQTTVAQEITVVVINQPPKCFKSPSEVVFDFI